MRDYLRNGWEGWDCSAWRLMRDLVTGCKHLMLPVSLRQPLGFACCCRTQSMRFCKNLNKMSVKNVCMGQHRGAPRGPEKQTMWTRGTSRWACESETTVLSSQWVAGGQYLPANSESITGCRLGQCVFPFPQVNVLVRSFCLHDSCPVIYFWCV